MRETFTPYRKFLRTHKLKKIISYYEDSMDIASDILKGGVINRFGVLFKIGDVIKVDGLKLKVIGFAAYDDDWFGAICVGRNKSIAKWFSLDEAVNLTTRR